MEITHHFIWLLPSVLSVHSTYGEITHGMKIQEQYNEVNYSINEKQPANDYIDSICSYACVSIQNPY